PAATVAVAGARGGHGDERRPDAAVGELPVVGEDGLGTGGVDVERPARRAERLEGGADEGEPRDVDDERKVFVKTGRIAPERAAIGAGGNLDDLADGSALGVDLA